MTTTPRRLEERVFHLERFIAGLQSEIQALKTQQQFGGERFQWRIAQVTSTPGGTSDNTFAVVFLDGTFTEAAGQQSVTWTDRQLAARVVVRNLGDTLPTYGDIVPVFRWSNRWWANVGATTGGGTNPIAQAQINFLHNPNWFDWGGANDGALASSTQRIDCIPARNNAGYYCFLQDRIGPDIGIVMGSNHVTQFQLTEPGYYHIHLICDVYQSYEHTGSYAMPTDEQFYTARFELQCGTTGRVPVWSPLTKWPILEVPMSTNGIPDHLVTGNNPGDVYLMQSGSKKNAHGMIAERWTVSTVSPATLTLIASRSPCQGFTDFSSDPASEQGCTFIRPVLSVTKITQ